MTKRFAELTKGRSGAVTFDATLTARGLELPGTESDAASVMDALSVGTRDHLATLIRLSIAMQLESAIVLELPKFRRRGVYEALTLVRLREARRGGLLLATTRPMADTSAPLLDQRGGGEECIRRV